MKFAGLAAFILLSINPIGGAIVSIPFAVFELKYDPLLTWALAFPLSYAQVIAVDLGWNALWRWGFFRAQLEKRRSAWVERLLASPGAFWPTLVLAPLVGPWLVMALMRYARVPQRKVAAPILLGLGAWTAVLSWSCVLAPKLLRR